MAFSLWDPQGVGWAASQRLAKQAAPPPGTTTLNSAGGSVAQPGNLTMDPASRDAAIRTMYGEAAGESPAGQGAVFQTMLNRQAQGGPGAAGGIPGVAHAPLQYSTWNTGRGGNQLGRNLDPNSPDYQHLGDMADQIYAGLVPDPTQGSQNYYNPSQVSPGWAGPLAKQGSVPIGQHLFVGRGPTRVSPAAVAGSAEDEGWANG